MKFVLFVVALLVLLWLIKGSIARRVRPPSAPGHGEPAGKPLAMVACLQCGLHVPRHEALPGRGGVFCGEAHRAEYERSHPGA